MGKTNGKGRATGDGSHVRLYERFTRTAAWRSLTPYDRLLYIELKRLYRGNDEENNNGQLFLSVRRAADLLGTVQLDHEGNPLDPRVGTPIAKATVQKAFANLEDRGFIKAVQAGSFDWKKKKATSWVLTEFWLKKVPATRDFDRWEPSASGPRPRRMTPQERKKSVPPDGHLVPPDGHAVPPDGHHHPEVSVSWDDSGAFRAQPVPPDGRI